MSEARLLLCTDMDRTIIPNGHQIEPPHARERFRRLCSQPAVTLIYVTGRHQALVKEAIDSYDLPLPDYVVSDVGTRIYQVGTQGWQAIPQWEEQIAKDWNGHSREQIERLLSHLSDGRALWLQEHDKQNTYKLSYYFPFTDDPESITIKMKERLQDEGIQASLVCSLDEPNEVGLLDVLPRHATKRHAIEFLQHRLGYSDQELIFAGDSGNDLPVLTSHIQSILVGNASEAIRDQAVRQAAEQGNAEALFLAGQSGTASESGFGNYADGVLEGVRYFRGDLIHFWEEKGEAHGRSG